MERDTNGNGKGKLTQTPPTAYIGTMFASPNTTANYARTSNSQGYQQVVKVNHEDKQTGSYQRYTAREEVSTGEMYRGRGHKEYGVKDEHKTSDTFKVGNKSGYTEYYREERVRDVSYGGGSHNAAGGKNIEYGGSNNKNNYCYGGGGGGGGGGGNNSDSDSDSDYESESEPDSYSDYDSDSD